MSALISLLDVRVVRIHLSNGKMTNRCCVKYSVKIDVKVELQV